MQQPDLSLIPSLISRHIGVPATALVLVCVTEEADGEAAVRAYYLPETINTLGILAPVFRRLIDFEHDYCEALLDFGDPGVPLNSPSVADSLDSIAADLGVERVVCVITLSDQGVPLAARDYAGLEYTLLEKVGSQLHAVLEDTEEAFHTGSLMVH